MSRVVVIMGNLGTHGVGSKRKWLVIASHKQQQVVESPSVLCFRVSELHAISQLGEGEVEQSEAHPSPGKRLLASFSYASVVAVRAGI